MHAVDAARLVTPHARYLLLQRFAKLHCKGAEASRNHAGSDAPTVKEGNLTGGHTHGKIRAVRAWSDICSLQGSAFHVNIVRARHGNLKGNLCNQQSDLNFNREQEHNMLQHGCQN